MIRYFGIDLGAETVKAVELVGSSGSFQIARRARVDHHKDPASALVPILREWDFESAQGAFATGRLGRQLTVGRIPGKQARIAGARHVHGDERAVVIDIGAHGFSVLVLGDDGPESYRENPRCSQGTGNFLRQLVERFGLTPEEADAIAVQAAQAAPLSGRCPVILKTDMTHLANKGEDRSRILAGLFDAICENVQVLVKAQGPARMVLAGGVGRSQRVRDRFRDFASRRDMRLVDPVGDDDLFLDAIGCGVIAARMGTEPLPPLDRLFADAQHGSLERRPALSEALHQVRRLARSPRDPGGTAPVVLGLDIGSTGSKAVAVDAASREPVWEAYVRTSGDPVGAAQTLVAELVKGPARERPVLGVGVTGSGREIVRSLMATCYGPERVFVVNEIAAHAEGARAYDPRVDTIFEIGGQDAKYIRLQEGRIVDAAMNEACSAGTGSFIEEQGRRLGGLDAAALAKEAIGADGCIALGQHCAVFMAEILDEAAAAGADREHIIAGLYDSVVQNYLNRVKGSRSVGEVIFCQGMPFAADALAAAVARQTQAEVIVPPSPGTVGAFGIALLANGALTPGEPLDAARFLEARVDKKETFVCKSTSGCGGSGNACRIDRLRTVVEGSRQAFTWGGACSLYDKGTQGRKLPDGAPDPFREREALVDDLLARLGSAPGAKRIAITEAFQLKALFPYFATLLRRLGLDLHVVRATGHEQLRRGIEAANIPYCAPMQQYHGLVAEMAASDADVVFLPVIRDLPPVKDEKHTWLCPIVQGSSDVVRWDLSDLLKGRGLAPVFRNGPGFLESPRFLGGVAKLAAELGVADEATWRRAHEDARGEQLRFERALTEIGRRALDRCREQGIVAVVVLGRAYTIHDDVLNSNLPTLLREQGAVAIPADCYPVSDETPIVPGAFWGYTQRILRASYEIRRTPGVYGIFASNYACGPDSFTLHHFARLMEGKPFSIIETDGHSGDAGTKTRVEAFLHCVREDLRSGASGCGEAAGLLQVNSRTLPEVAASGARVLVPPMGPESEALAAAMRGFGVAAEVLPRATVDTIRLGRRHTSGKECLPMTVTAGALLERLERAGDEQLAFFMPSSNGPCRFGMYRQLHQMIVDRLGHGAKVGIWSPPDSDYFEGVPPGLGAIVLAGCAAFGALEDAVRDVRPVEARLGAVAEIHARYARELSRAIEKAARGDLSAKHVLLEVFSGRIYGIPAVAEAAARELAAVRSDKPCPTVLLVGEIYVRSDPAANGFVADELERRGLRVRLEPVVEYLQYSEYNQFRRGLKRGVKDALQAGLRSRIVHGVQHAVAHALGWPAHPRVEELVETARPYLGPDLEHEAVLAVGLPLWAYRNGLIDGVVNAGPLECMPSKLAEAQLVHVGSKEGLHSMTLALNGDPLDPETLDDFAYEVRERHRARVARS